MYFFQDCKHFNLDLADEVRRKPLGAFTPNFNLLDSVRAFIIASLPTGSYKKADGTLHLSLTTFNGLRWPVNKVVSRYCSDHELIEVSIARAFLYK